MRRATPVALLCIAAAGAAELRIEVRDERNRPAAARLEVHGPGGRMYQAEGSITGRRPGRSDAGSAYLRSFIVKGSAALSVPPGRYRIIAERGLEYERVTKEVEVRDDAAVEVRPRPWIRMSERGWWSGDMHVHRPPEDVPVLLEAEDLNLGVVFTMWNRQNLYAARALPAEWIVKTGPSNWMTITNAEDERGGGAWMLHGLREALGLEAVVPAGKPVTESWDPPGMDFVRKARLRKQGLFPWFDLEKPIWWEAPVMMALERPDSIGLLHNHYDQYGMYDNEAWGRKRDMAAFPGPPGFSDYSLQLIYRYWNLGWLVPPSAGSASGVLPNPVGYNRMYVYLQGPFSLNKWYEALKAGRVMVSNGPALFFEPKVEGGRLRGRIEAVSRDDLDRVELVANGQVIQSWKPVGKRFHWVLDLSVASHGWVAARCYAKNDSTVRMAHTGPVRLPGKWDSRADAAYYRQWIEELQRNPKTPEGSKAAELYRQAVEVYRNLEK